MLLINIVGPKMTMGNFSHVVKVMFLLGSQKCSPYVKDLLINPHVFFFAPENPNAEVIEDPAARLPRWCPLHSQIGGAGQWENGVRMIGSNEGPVTPNECLAHWIF